MNLVNNLAYAQSVVDVQRFSSAWDISTGPVGHETPGPEWRIPEGEIGPVDVPPGVTVPAGSQHPFFSRFLVSVLGFLHYPVPGPDRGPELLTGLFVEGVSAKSEFQFWPTAGVLFPPFLLPLL